MITTMAREVVLDWPGREIRVDGVPLGFHVGVDVGMLVEPNDVPRVVLEVMADNVTVIEPDGRVRRPAVAPRYIDVAWAGQRGREIVRQGLADVLAWLGEAA